MRHKCHRSRLNRSLGHRTATLRNLAKALIEHERIETTQTKAKTLRPFVEGLITLSKKGSLHHRRQAFSKLNCKKAVHKLFEELGARYQSRNGGYTRIILGRRRMGDGSEMAYIELIDRKPTQAEAKQQETPAATAG